MAEPVRVDDRGRIVLPAGLRRQLGLVAGDELLAEVDGPGLRLVSRRAAAFALLGAAAGDDHDGGAVSDLLRERRRDLDDDLGSDA
ncbi:MAG: AbrB/MazE/SpoVT family DNA-binding domain-containing protein [Pseudonocardia sp.]|jgi:AbrB family looped-hinge helix DNA binding protein